MSLDFTPYVLAQAASALISLLAAVVAWRRRAAPGGTAFALMLTSVSIWTAAVSLEESSVGIPVKIIFSKISYLGAVNVAPFFLLFAWNFRHGDRAARLPVVLIIWILPAALLGLAVTNEWHGLFWTSVRLAEPSAGNLAVYGHGPAWWILSCYDFALVAIATAWIGSRALGAPRIFARQNGVVLAAVIVVWAGFAVYVAPGNPVPGLDLPALSFSVAGFLILWGLTRGRMLALNPIAREMLVEAMPDGLIVEDSRGRIIDANPVALSLLGRDTSVIGSPLADALAEWPDLASDVARARDGGMDLVRRGSRVFELTVAALQGPQGDQMGRMVVLRDITERRRAEEATAESERNLRTLLAAAERQAKERELLDQVRTSLASELDLSVIFRTVVEGIARTFGYSQVSLYTLEGEALVLRHQVGYSRLFARIPVTQGITGRVIRSGRPVLVKNVAADPEYLGAMEGVVSEVCIPLFEQGRPVGALNVESTRGAAMGEEDLRIMTVLGEHVSIALSKAGLYAEARENEERYRVLVTTLGEGVAIVDLLERFVFANPAAESVFGVPSGGLVGRSLEEFLGPAELALSLSETHKRVQGLRSTYELPIRRPDGETRRIELIATPRYGSGGEVIGTLGIFRDVTELRRLQRSLEQERSLLLSLIDNLPDYVYLKDRSSRFILTNKAQAAFVGKNDPKELIGRTDHDFMAKDLADRSRADDLHIMESGIGVANIEELSENAGGLRKVLTTKVPIFDATGTVTGLVGISRDVTDLTRAEEERARLQEQLQQSQKMEAVGRLAGGIAHDFNNILTVISGYCELALEESRGNRVLEGNMEEIKRAARRASALISQLLAFSRRQILQPRVFDLADLVEGMQGMLRRLLGEDISLRTFRTGRSLYVHADPGRVEQVVMNLAVNSRDAMPGGGSLTIHTTVGQLPPGEAAGHPELGDGEFVLLSVSDTGDGMDAATLDRLFEPFFTTKEMGKGTGLGLATVYGIVRQSSGHITCRSQVGSGTTFTIFLPRASQEEADREGIEMLPAKLPQGTGRILLVEDDESVRRFVKTVLETAGYTVFATDSGASALENLDSLTEPPDLLVTDVIMPGMDGRVLAQEVTRRLPGIRFILMSGYAEVAAGVPGTQDSDSKLILKPFAAGDLLRKVSQVLSRPASEGT
ncbi:MAG: histidine kinase N-terminal 7TM domain-containing protein [Spirochaetia bacterium]|jgi:PAS domain S-box-containing protein